MEYLFICVQNRLVAKMFVLLSSLSDILDLSTDQLQFTETCFECAIITFTAGQTSGAYKGEFKSSKLSSLL